MLSQMLLFKQAALVLHRKLKLTQQSLPSPRTLTSSGSRRSVAMAAMPGLFPHPESVVLYVMEAALAASGPLLMHKEATGKRNMTYSKFATGKVKEAVMVPSRTGMFVFYFPAAVVATLFLAYRAGFLPLPFGDSGVAAFLEHGVAAGGDRLLLVAAALSLHHVKRCVEVLFVHKQSGSTSVDTMGVIATSYFLQVCFLLYSQLLSAGAADPSPDLKWLGVVLFAVGMLGNGYHHWMLAHLRKDGNKKYVVPRGGLFELFVCPHYIFEMMDYVGLALISQTLYGWVMASFTIFYLTGRSIATKEWYKKKVDGFPEDRSVLIPGVF